MPPFARILKGQEDGIIDYLFEKTDKSFISKASRTRRDKEQQVIKHRSK